jgi:NitT/TauT family transport system permease protein
MPWIVSSLHVNIGLALAGTIVGEFIASQAGVGRMILYAGQTMDINLVWVGVVVLSLMAILMYWAVSWFEKVVLKGFMHGAQSAGR